jgi:hypothetical protein
MSRGPGVLIDGQVLEGGMMAADFRAFLRMGYDVAFEGQDGYACTLGECLAAHVNSVHNAIAELERFVISEDFITGEFEPE